MMNLFKKKKDFFQVEVPNTCKSQAEVVQRCATAQGLCSSDVLHWWTQD